MGKVGSRICLAVTEMLNVFSTTAFSQNSTKEEMEKIMIVTE
jgi:hypothetical protein